MHGVIFDWSIVSDALAQDSGKISDTFLFSVFLLAGSWHFLSLLAVLDPVLKCLTVLNYYTGL